MLEYDQELQPERHPTISLLLIFAVVFVGFLIVGPMIGLILSLPFYSGSMVEYIEALQDIDNHPEIKTSLYIMQGCATFIGLIVGPALFLKAERKTLGIFFQNDRIQLIPVVITIMVVVVSMAVNSVFIEWNASIHLPEFLKDFENWARLREDEAARITEFLIHFDSPFEVAVAMVVIAILPAIGEEIVFRGLIQNEFYRGTKNIHLSVWISAILFSAIHMQFFGFIPRMLLGALFGYLYFWSGSLSLAILAHFVNNGLSVMAMYFTQLGYFDLDIESTESAPYPAVIFSALATATLLFYFRKYYQQRLG